MQEAFVKKNYAVLKVLMNNLMCVCSLHRVFVISLFNMAKGQKCYENVYLQKGFNEKRYMCLLLVSTRNIKPHIF